jgi:hypothetical protein
MKEDNLLILRHSPFSKFYFSGIINNYKLWIMFIFLTLNVNNYVVWPTIVWNDSSWHWCFPEHYSLSNSIRFIVLFLSLFYVKYIYYILCLCLYEWQNGFKL